MSDIIDINVNKTVEQVEILVTENLTTVNVNTITGTEDPTAVKLTTNQTIDGVKTFVQPIKGDADFSPNITDLDYTQKIFVVNAIADSIEGVERQSNKNQNNGYSGLDSGGKIPLANLPTTLLKYQGVWNASTNTPTLTNPDLTKVGNVYNVSVAGTQFGITFGLGDWLIYNASGIPEKSDNSDDVVSVNGQTGVVIITKSDVGLSNVDNTSDANKPVSTAQQNAINVASQWTRTSNNIRNNNTGNVEVKLNGTKLSILNNLNQEVGFFADNGQYQIMGGGGIFGNGSGCRLTFSNNVFNFKSFAGNSTRFVFESDLLNTSGNVDVISFGNQTINPTSGNATFNIYDIEPVINQTGGANGVTRGVYINPTLTSATDFRALEITAGKVIIPNGSTSNEAVNKGQLDLKSNTANPTFTGNVIASANILPLTDNASDLGSISLNFRSILVRLVRSPVGQTYQANSHAFVDNTSIQQARIYSTTGNLALQNGGTYNDIPSARLQVNSTTQGFLAPRMTNAQRIAIASPAIGLMVYCTDAVEGVYVFKSTGWTFIG